MGTTALRVAYFEVLRWRKHMRKRRFILSEEIIDSLSTSASIQEELEEARHLALQDCLSQLPSTQRKVVDQRYTSKGTLKELAQKLGITTHKIYHTLDNAREALVACVEKKLLNRGFDLNT